MSSGSRCDGVAGEYEELPSEAVVRAVADAADRDPETMEPLYAAIDPDALDSVLTPVCGGPGAADTTVAFTYAGYRVRLTGDGSVSILDDGE